FIFFFFQAEDGIRDRNVTGVQTCALPISGSCWACSAGVVSPGGWRHAASPRRRGRHERDRSAGSGAAGGHRRRPRCRRALGRERSEERRVGREWRAWRVEGEEEEQSVREV